MSSVFPRQGLARPRLGFLGVGWIGRKRLEAIVGSGLAEIAAVADPIDAVAEEVRALAPGCERASGLKDLLHHELDGLVIATPSAFHAEQSEEALEAGLSVFCQKPLGRSAGEVRRVVELARRKNLLLGVDLCYRHLSGVTEIHEAIEAGDLGRIVGVDLTFHNAYGPDKPWFYDPRLSGGGCIIDLGIHLVDLALWMLPTDQVVSVKAQRFARGEPVKGRTQVEDFACAQLELSSGAVAQLRCSWNLHAGQEAVIEASFYGTEGGAAVRNVNGSFYDFVVERFRGIRRTRLAAPPDAWGGRAAVAWVQQLAEGASFDRGAERWIDVADVLDRIYTA